MQISCVPATSPLQALRNISLIIQAYPAVLANDVKVSAWVCMTRPRSMQHVVWYVHFALMA